MKEQLKHLAEMFLNIADNNEELVSAYIDGSRSKKAEKAYEKVLRAEAEFLMAYNKYYSDNVKPALNYELAEDFIN